MEKEVYELIRNLNCFSTYKDITYAIKGTLEYFSKEKSIYKKRRLVKYWGTTLGSYTVSEAFNQYHHKDYHIFDIEKSAMYNTAYYFSGLTDIRDFKIMASEIIKIYDTELIDCENQHITEKEVREALEIVENKVTLFKDKKLTDYIYVFLHAKQNTKFNSYVIPFFKETKNRYYINCFKMSDKKINPVYVFFHELGHVLLCELMGNTTDIPYSFYELVKEIIDIDYVDSKEKMLEIFCEMFASTMLLETKYEKYIPYKLDKYEKKTLLRYFKSIDFYKNQYDAYLDLHRFYYKLLEQVKKEGPLNLKDIQDDEWKQLSVVEHCGQGLLEDLFKENKRQITDFRKNKIGNIKNVYYSLDWFTYFFISGGGRINSIILLEQLKSNGGKEIFETNYANKMVYKKKFDIQEEIMNQQEILAYNLNNQNKKETLDDFLLARASRMLKRGELTLDYLNSEFIQNPEFIFNGIKEKIESLDLKTNSSETVFVKLETFHNHQSKKAKTKKTGGKKDFLEQYTNQQKSGSTGEEFAYEEEKKRLKDYPELQEKIIPYFKIDPNKGYDILSYEIDGTEKKIEVKSSATNNSDKKIHFFISSNEDEFLKNNENACIYYVYNFKNKKIREIKREQYLNMTKTPRVFEVDIDCE